MKNFVEHNKKYILEVLLYICVFYVYFAILLQDISPLFQLIFLGSISITFLLFFVIEKNQSFYSRFVILYLLYILYILFQIFRMIDTSLAFNGFYEYVFFTFPFFSVVFLIKKLKIDIRIRKYLNNEIMIITILMFILSLYEFLFGVSVSKMDLHYFNESINSFGRAQVFSGSPLIFAMLMCVLVIFHQYMFIKNKRRKDVILFTLSFSSVLFSGSRGPLIALICALLFQIVLNYLSKNVFKVFLKKKSISYLISILSFLILFGFFLFNYSGENQVILKLSSIFNWKTDLGNLRRLTNWKLFIDYFYKNPILGIGISRTGSVTLNHSLSVGVTESTILKILVEIGLIGFILYFGQIFSIFLKGIKSLKHSRARSKDEIILFLSLILLVIVEGFILQITEIILISTIFWGSLGAVYQLSISEGENNYVQL